VSVFEKYKTKAYPYNYVAELHVPIINGGTPTDPKVAEGWLKTKLGIDKDDLVREAVAEVMVERGVSAEEATAEVSKNKHLNGFKRGEHGLYIEGRQVKAAIKEAANIRWPNGRWSVDKNGKARLVHTFRGSGIQYEEYVEDAKLTFTVATDAELTEEMWALLWLTGQEQGIGASRSQGYGRYEVTRWERV
jgi:hypothetical protein